MHIKYIWVRKLILREFPLGFIFNVKDWKVKQSLLLKVSQNLVAYIIKVWESVTEKWVKIVFGEGEAQKYVIHNHQQIINNKKQHIS